LVGVSDFNGAFNFPVGKNKLGNRESRERKEMREKGKHGYGI